MNSTCFVRLILFVIDSSYSRLTPSSFDMIRKFNANLTQNEWIKIKGSDMFNRISWIKVNLYSLVSMHPGAKPPYALKGIWAPHTIRWSPKKLLFLK